MSNEPNLGLTHVRELPGKQDPENSLPDLGIAHEDDVENAPGDTSESFYFSFFRLGLVNILSNLMVPLAGLVDIAFLGHLSDLSYLAGVAIATVLFDYLYRISKFLRMGTTGPTAHAEGKGDRDAVLLALLRNGLIAIAMSAVILLLQWPIRDLGFLLLNAAPDVKMAGLEYFNARIWGAPAVLLNFVVMGWLVGRAQGRKVLTLSVIGNGANMLLDYWFVFHLNWASAGVGLATCLSQYIMLFLGLGFVIQEGWLSQIPRVWNQVLQSEAVKATFKLNTDIWIRSCVNVSIYALFIGMSSGFGTLALSANTLMLHVVVMTAYVVDGLAFATESFAGRYSGEGKPEKLSPLIQLSIALSALIGLGVALLFVLFPMTLFGILTNHLEVIDQINHYLFWLMPVLGLGSLAFMLNGYFLGLMQSAIVRNSIVFSALIGFLPVAFWAWKTENDQLLWLAMAIFMGIRAVTQWMKVSSTTQIGFQSIQQELLTN